MEPITVLSTQQCDVGPRAERLPRRVILPVLLALVFLLASCAGSTPRPGVAPTTGLSSPLGSLGPLPSALGGARFNPAALAGKPVVLWFWAPWCPICRADGPAIAKVAAEFAGKVEFVGVAGQGTVPAMTAFVRQTGTGDITHLADVNGVIWRDYGVSAQPAFAFIAPDGTADLRVGALDEQTLRARVAELAAGARTSKVTMTPGLYCSRAPDGRLICGASGPPHTTTPAHTSSTVT